MKIEKGIPVPSLRHHDMPLDQMAVGDSIYFAADPNNPHMIERVRNKFWLYGRLHDVKFKSRAVEGGWRVWRTK